MSYKLSRQELWFEKLVIAVVRRFKEADKAPPQSEDQVMCRTLSTLLSDFSNGSELLCALSGIVDYNAGALPSYCSDKFQ